MPIDVLASHMHAQIEIAPSRHLQLASVSAAASASACACLALVIIWCDPKAVLIVQNRIVQHPTQQIESESKRKHRETERERETETESQALNERAAKGKETNRW